MGSPTPAEVADRALILYAFVRRGYIEHVIASTGGDPLRIRQAEAARAETDGWLEREQLREALTGNETALLAATSGSWPPAATADAMWRKEALGTLLWALQHLAVMPPFDTEFEQRTLDHAITRSGSTASFRSEGMLRQVDALQAVWMEADAWVGATEGQEGDDAALASIAAERYRALSWLRDADGPPA